MSEKGVFRIVNVSFWLRIVATMFYIEDSMQSFHQGCEAGGGAGLGWGETTGAIAPGRYFGMVA